MWRGTFLSVRYARVTRFGFNVARNLPHNLFMGSVASALFYGPAPPRPPASASVGFYVDDGMLVKHSYWIEGDVQRHACETVALGEGVTVVNAPRSFTFFGKRRAMAVRPYMEMLEFRWAGPSCAFSKTASIEENDLVVGYVSTCDTWEEAKKYDIWESNQEPRPGQHRILIVAGASERERESGR